MDVVSKEKRETRSCNRHQIKAQTRKTLKKKKARKDQTRKTSAGGKVTTKPTRNTQLCTFCKKMNDYSKLCGSKQVHQLKEEDDSQVSSDDSGDSGDESSHWCTWSNQCVAEDEQFYETVEVEETRKTTRSW